MDWAVVLAGRSGTRFWPMSREEMPKQALHMPDLFEALSLICAHLDQVDDDDTMALVWDQALKETIGVADLIIVDTPDALLVCNKDQEQDVRAVVHFLEPGDR